MTKNDKKVTITEDVVQYAARLSRIDLDEKDLEKFQLQLSRILDYIAQLDEVDTEGVLATTHVLASMKNVFRDDNITESVSSEQALINAPDKKGDFFKVPKIIKDA
ncbi:MAG: Asp-tRNA(Asn)/Glu-tRNA(Gln) amidotransferase subunit GatC [Candidatus Omnitrophota bacterium]